jgi:hypothetical protein
VTLPDMSDLGRDAEAPLTPLDDTVRVLTLSATL